ELAFHHLRAAFGMNGDLEGRKLRVVRRGLETALQFEGGEMRICIRPLLSWLGRVCCLRVYRLLPRSRCGRIGAVRQRRGDTQDDRAVVAWLGSESGDVALKQNGGVAVGVAQRGFEAEDTVGVARTRGEAEFLRPPCKIVGRRDLVGTRQRRGAA